MPSFNESTRRERGTPLTAWLVVMLAANIFSTLLYPVLETSPALRVLLFSTIASWAIYLFTALGALNIALVVFLFLWKKWAFFGLCGSAAIALAVNLYVGSGGFSFLGVGEPVITYLVLLPKWNSLDKI